jgi:hypothetical protein
VEPELGRGQARVERVGHKPLACSWQVCAHVAK